ncbi:MAG: hypothetical protein GXX96_21725 [Planctomycetaceae bacterium]|nr:hypothetical protein [Planctomycetaceae bacterium]
MSRKAISSLLILLVLSVDAACGDSPLVARVDVGFAGSYKAGLWTPVRIHFTPHPDLDGAQVSLIVPDGDGVPSRVSAPLPSPAPDSLLLYARFGRLNSPLTVRLEGSGKLLEERLFETGQSPGDKTIPAALRSNQPLVVVVGTAPLGIADAVARIREPEEEETRLVTLDDAAALPDRWYGYEGVRLVVLSGTDLKCYSALKPDDDRVVALSQWVRQGGRLLIAVGEYGEQLLGADGPLRDLVPGRFEKTISLSQARELERFVDSQKGLPSRVDGKMLQIAQLTGVEGVVDVREGNLPLVVNRVWGFGQLTFLASDLDRGPVGKWEDRPTLVARLLGWPEKPVEYEREDKTIRHFGYTDLAGQLRSALDQFDGVRQIPFTLIIAAVVVYLLLIGPGDYFLLRKVLRRMELTWITFPATVVLFCVVAYLVACRTKGDRFLVNQATVIDVDTQTAQLRGTAWANVFSPETRRADLRFTVPPPEQGKPATPEAQPQQVTAWLGLPGKALGAMEPVTPPPVVWSEPYDFNDHAAWLGNLPLQVWSSKSLTTRWTGHVDASFQSDLEEKGPIPSGQLTSRLDMPLNDCLLVYGSWVYELGTIAPGQQVRVGATVPRRELASFLTGRKLVFDAKEERALQRATRYSVESTDPDYVLRAMTFFQAAGGRPYTSLANAYQGFVDMSGLLRPNRAVLIARAAGSEDGRALPLSARISLSSNGRTVPLHEKHTTLLRFVLPVRPDER